MSTDRAIHPVADIFPPMGAREFDALCEDIRQHGLREPIWLHPDGSVIDGRHRLRACAREGVEPRFRTWDGDGALVAFVVSLNLHRRHLDEGQRALVAGRIANMRQGQRTDLELSANLPKVSLSDAAELLNVGERSVRHARQVLDEGTPELVAAVESGDLSVSFAAKVAELPAADQEDIAVLPKAEAIEEYKRRVHVANNSGNNEWYTPLDILEQARLTLGGFDCDPASSPVANESVRADTYYTAEDDGLQQATWGRRVWMNPPYAQPLIAQFCESFVERHARGEIASGIVLVNNGTETAWGQHLLAHAAAVCFPKGRIRFVDASGKPSGTPLQGQMIVYFGREAPLFAENFAYFGQVLIAVAGS